MQTTHTARWQSTFHCSVCVLVCVPMKCVLTAVSSPLEVYWWQKICESTHEVCLSLQVNIWACTGTESQIWACTLNYLQLLWQFSKHSLSWKISLLSATRHFHIQTLVMSSSQQHVTPLRTLEILRRDLHCRLKHPDLTQRWHGHYDIWLAATFKLI